MSEQLSFPHTTWPCDVCTATGLEENRETGTIRNCRICGGLGRIPYDPELAQADPFHGLDGQERR